MVCKNLTIRRGVRVVEGARLESVCASNGTAGSNPVLSAKKNDQTFVWSFFLSE